MNSPRSVAVRLGITPFDVLAVSLFFGGLAAYSLTGITWLALIPLVVIAVLVAVRLAGVE